MVGTKVSVSYHSPFERKVSPCGDAKVIVSPITAKVPSYLLYKYNATYSDRKLRKKHNFLHDGQRVNKTQENYTRKTFCLIRTLKIFPFLGSVYKLFLATFFSSLVGVFKKIDKPRKLPKPNHTAPIRVV